MTPITPPTDPKVLSLFFAYNELTMLTMTEHITAILSTCSSSTHALRLKRSPTTGATPGRQSNYSSLNPLRGAGVVGIRRRGDRHRLERLVASMRSGYLPPYFPDLATLVEDADTKLFNSIRHNSTHVLSHYLLSYR